MSIEECTHDDEQIGVEPWDNAAPSLRIRYQTVVYACQKCDRIRLSCERRNAALGEFSD